MYVFVYKGVGNMSKCPFWSTKGNRVECYSDCPMMNFSCSDENCVFKENLTDDKLLFKGIEDNAYSYQTNDIMDFDYLIKSSNY